MFRSDLEINVQCPIFVQVWRALLLHRVVVHQYFYHFPNNLTIYPVFELYGFRSLLERGIRSSVRDG